MTLRQRIGLSALLSVSAACWFAAQARADEAAPAKRTLAFAIGGGPAGGAAPSLQCIVDAGPALPIAALAFTPDGEWLAVGGYQEVLLWHLDGAKLAKRLGVGQLAGMVQAVVFVDGGKALAVGDGLPYQSGAVKIFDVETGQPTTTLAESKNVVCRLALSPDGKSLAVGDADAHVYVWDLATGQLAKTIDAHKGWVLGLAFSPDGKRLATAGTDQTLQVWDVSNWERIIQYNLAATAHAATFSPDSKTVIAAVGGLDEEPSLRTGRIDADVEQASRRAPKTQTMSTGTGAPLDIVWPVKGAYLFAACDDSTVRAYQNGAKFTAPLRGHADWVYGVAATPDGTKVASGSADGTVKLWSITGGKPLATLVQLTPRSDDWLIITPQGHFTCSSPEAIRWKTSGSSPSPQELTARYHNPELVCKALAESAIQPPAAQGKSKTAPRPADNSKQQKKQ